MRTTGNLRIEVMVLPVTDVDAAKVFLVERAGFCLDVDYRPSIDFRVVQITPPGSACSIQLVGAGDPEPRTTYLVVEDIVAARDQLIGRGVEVGALRHKVPRDAWAGSWGEGPDSGRADYATFAEFVDLDGHRWVLQERALIS
jgi:hypothetical protein